MFNRIFATACAGLLCGLAACEASDPASPADRPALSQAPVEAPLSVQIDDVNACTGEPITLTYAGIAKLQEFADHSVLHVNGSVTTTDGYTGIFNWTFVNQDDQVAHVSAHDMEVSDATGQRIIFPVGMEQRTTVDGTLIVSIVHFADGRVRCLGKPSTVPSLTVSANPDNGNPRIVRFQDLTGFMLIDPVSNLFSLTASLNDDFGCNATPELLSLVDVQFILHNSGDPLAGQINNVVQGQGVYIAVFQGWNGWVASGFDCADLAARKLADGTGNLTVTDNDVFGFLRENTNHNAFGFVSQGRLERVGGGSVAYSGVSRCVWDGEDGATSRCVDSIRF